MSLLSVYFRIKPEEMVATGKVPLIVMAEMQGSKWKYIWSLKGISTCHFCFLILAKMKYMSEPKDR